MRLNFYFRLTFVILFGIVLFSESFCQLPSSRRSRRAIARVKPALQVSLAEDSLEFGSSIFIRIFKESNELELWVKKDDRYKLFRNYPICYYSGYLGPKLRQGDIQSPEGFYFVTPQRLNPVSNFHLSFNIGYPNAYDRHHGRTGGAIMIHGNCVSIGCYAMTDRNIEKIYALADAALRSGQRFFRIHIFPFRMRKEKMAAHSESQWIDFWRNLKQGYDYFEKHKKPPNVLVRDNIYIFEDDG